MQFQLTLPSPAERGVALAYCGLALAGAVLGAGTLSGLDGFEMLLGADASLFLRGLAGAIGGIVSGAALRGRFGQFGLRGDATAFFAALLATMSLGIVAGTLVLPILGTMFAPWLIIVAIGSKPWLALPWAVALFSFHIARRAHRAERDSIFKWIEKLDGA